MSLLPILDAVHPPYHLQDLGEITGDERAEHRAPDYAAGASLGLLQQNANATLDLMVPLANPKLLEFALCCSEPPTTPPPFRSLRELVAVHNVLAVDGTTDTWNGDCRYREREPGSVTLAGVHQALPTRIKSNVEHCSLHH